MTNSKKQKVLFIGTTNSARSQMAELLLRYKAGDKFSVFSAGTHPETVDLRTIEALTQFGISAKNLSAKDIKEFEHQKFDYVISLCDKANTQCRNHPKAGKQLAWDFANPKTRIDSNPFMTTLTELNNRLSMFLLIEEESFLQKNKCQIIENKQIKKPLVGTDFNIDSSVESNFYPTEFYKCLTDDVRLKTLMLAHYHGELCVCELMAALEEKSQPKVSRNLAVLKKAKVIIDRKQGQWVFYQINPALPLWIKSVIAQTTENNIMLIKRELQRLDLMKNRPNRTKFNRERSTPPSGISINKRITNGYF
ncbi:MAG: metalloregulator ArsR/SmtB family transcription factor [Colwellia sp.]